MKKINYLLLLFVSLMFISCQNDDEQSENGDNTEIEAGDKHHEGCDHDGKHHGDCDHKDGHHHKCEKGEKCNKECKKHCEKECDKKCDKDKASCDKMKCDNCCEKCIESCKTGETCCTADKKCCEKCEEGCCTKTSDTEEGTEKGEGEEE